MKNILKDKLENVLMGYSELITGKFNYDNSIVRDITSTIPNILYEQKIFDKDSFLAVGSVGKGNWARSPWICIMEKKLTRSTQRGVYLGYLFSEDMNSFYLTLTSGCTEFINKYGNRAGKQILKSLVKFSRKLINKNNGQKIKMDDGCQLGKGKLASAYEDGTIAYIKYERGSIPSDEVLFEDLKNILELYYEYIDVILNINEIYEADSFGLLNNDKFDLADSKNIIDNMMCSFFISFYYSRRIDSSLYLKFHNKFFIDLIDLFQNNPNIKGMDSILIQALYQSKKLYNSMVIEPFKFVINSRAYYYLDLLNFMNKLVEHRVFLSDKDYRKYTGRVENVESVNFNYTAEAEDYLIEYTILHALFMPDARLNESFVESYANAIAFQAYDDTKEESTISYCLNFFDDTFIRKILMRLGKYIGMSTYGDDNFRLVLNHSHLDHEFREYIMVLHDEVKFTDALLIDLFSSKEISITEFNTKYNFDEDIELAQIKIIDYPLVLGRKSSNIDGKFEFKYYFKHETIYNPEDFLQVDYAGQMFRVYNSELDIKVEALSMINKDQISIDLSHYNYDLHRHLYGPSFPDMDSYIKESEGDYFSDNVRKYNETGNENQYVKLMYIWVREFRVIKNEELNLSGNYEIFLDEKTLTIKKKSVEIPFGLSHLESVIDDYTDIECVDKINNINAVIGKNGSGKSTFIDLILKVFDNGGLNDLETEYIIVYEIENEIYCDYKFDGELQFCDEIDALVHKNSNKSKNFFDNTGIYYYSNIVDILSDTNEVQKTTNINMFSDSTQKIFALERENSDLGQVNEILIEKYKIIKFLIDYRNVLLDQCDRAVNEYPYIPLPFKVCYYDESEREEIIFNKINENQSESYEEYIDKQLKNLENFFNDNFKASSLLHEIEIKGLSSGEYARIALFARLHWFSLTESISAVKAMNTHRLKSQMYFVLDEAETYFHPEWQRAFVYDLIFILTQSFSHVDVVKSINIILATNSPFVMGDLPRENTLLLSDQNKEDNSDVPDGQSFAQNINTLLKSSFFVDELLGRYANYKIKGLIRMLKECNDSLIDGVSREYLEASINRIGEPVLRQILMNKLIEVYPTEPEKLINFYQAKIDDLKKQQNGRN